MQDGSIKIVLAVPVSSRSGEMLPGLQVLACAVHLVHPPAYIRLHCRMGALSYTMCQRMVGLRMCASYDEHS